MKKLFCTLLACLVVLSCFAACEKAGETAAAPAKDNNRVVIYTNFEDYRADKLVELVKEKYPDIELIVQFYDTGTMAAKIAAEGKDTDADIVIGLDEANAAKLQDIFAPLDGYDTSKYIDEVLPASNRYHIYCKDTGCVAYNEKVLSEKGLPVPDSYEELLDPMYRDLVMMPDPNSSGTGYIFYNSLVANWGEEKALEYFKKLGENVQQFSTSGSGPAKALNKGEIAVGLGTTFTAVQYANENPDIKIKYFAEGAPYALYTFNMIDGKQDREAVKTIYTYLYDEFCPLDKELFNPEVVYKDQTATMPGYPTEIPTSKMINMDSYEYKESLLDKWPIR